MTDAGAGAGRPAEILLIEDNLADARLTKEALRDGGIPHRLTLLFDGLEALEFLHRQGVFTRAPRPDLILLDLELPKMDGRELLERIKADEELRDIPLVVLTASTVHEDYLRSELLQVDAYLVKPVEVETFLTVVRQLKRATLERLLCPAPRL